MRQSVRDELAEALRSSLPRWNLEDDRQCREALARHEREPDDWPLLIVLLWAARHWRSGHSGWISAGPATLNLDAAIDACSGIPAGLIEEPKHD